MELEPLFTWKAIVKSFTMAITLLMIGSCGDDDSRPKLSDMSITAVASAYEITLTMTNGEDPYAYVITYQDGSTQEGFTTDTEITLEADKIADASITVTDATTKAVTDTVTQDDLSSLLDTRDGQRYGIVEINGELWLSENFNYDIPGDYCYSNNVSNCAEHGKLYTWAAATDKDFAPEGWALPTKKQIDLLDNLFDPGGGTKLKEGGSTGFEMKLSGAFLSASSTFTLIDDQGLFWTQTPSDDMPEQLAYYLTVTTEIFISDIHKSNALSVRLIQL